jgi:RimJ/RimL family protein N-acetyltransferase
MDFSFEKDILLENDRVLISPLKIDNTRNLLKVATEDSDLIRYSPSQISTEPLLTKYIQKAISDRSAKVRYPFIIFDKKLNEYAGSSSMGHISNVDKNVEIGWTWIGKRFQRTGLNRNCKYVMMQYIFETLQFERLELRTDERNRQSRKGIEGIGGKFEGILRSHMLMPDGYRRNTVCYSILRNEWDAIKKKLISTL